MLQRFPKRDWSDRGLDFTDQPRLDRSIMTGLGLSLSLVLIGIVASGEVLKFLNPISFIMVLGGSVGATLVQFSIEDLAEALRNVREALFAKRITPNEQIRYLVGLSQKMKVEGRLTLENEAQSTNDQFMRLGLEVTVDGQQEAEVKRILENEMRAATGRAERSVQIFESMGNFAPAIGLIGTLIGLIQMLGALQDPSVVGPAMSLALVTTLYGAIFANLIFFPISGKLRNLATERALLKTIALEGLVSLARDESPIIVEQKLQSFASMAVNG